jgi:uncharacterized protein YgiM (DUF1202 family)
MRIAVESTQGKSLRILAVLVAACLVGALLAVIGGPRARAAELPPSILEGGYIISDAAFFDHDSMTAAQIQTFLNGKVTTCQSGYTCLKSYKADIAAKSADKYCKALSAATGVTAATIIHRVALACGISPKVLLVMLQKEQGLVTSTAPSPTKYGKAMGQACPDTAACDPKFAGFFNQVYGAARQMQIYTLNPDSYSYKPGRINTIKWHPSSACGTSKVYVQNRATANLYIYTPYRPNVAALAAGSGTGDKCSSYGNRNFYNYYVAWFAPDATSKRPAALVPACQLPPSGDVAVRSGTATVTATTLNARTAPTLKCTAGLSTLSKGAKVTITGAYGMWTKATTGGRTVWLASEYLALPTAEAPASSGTACAVPSSSSIAAASGTVVVTAAVLNARLAPSTSCSTGLVQLTQGQTAARTGLYGEWVRVSLSGKSYWVHSDFVAVKATTQNPIVVQPAPTATIMKTTTAVNLRSAASTSSKVIVVVAKGVKVSAIGTSGSWRKVIVGSRTGWIYGKYLVKVTTAPVSSVKTTTVALNLRASASTTARVITVLPKGTKVTVIASSGVWRKVTVGSRTGWVHSAYLK